MKKKLPKSPWQKSPFHYLCSLQNFFLQEFKQKGTGKSAHDLTDDSTLSKSIVRLDQNDEESDEELPIEKDIPKPKEKSDADFDQEELDRVRQKFNAKKLAKQDKKKVLALDIDDDEEQNSSTTSKS